MDGRKNNKGHKGKAGRKGKAEEMQLIEMLNKHIDKDDAIKKLKTSQLTQSNLYLTFNVSDNNCNQKATRFNKKKESNSRRNVSGKDLWHSSYTY